MSTITVIDPSITSAEALLALNGNGKRLTLEAHHEIEQFVYYEARLLNEERLRDWYDLLDASLRYWCPIRENRFRADQTPELNPVAAALFDETKATIDLRLQRLESGKAWAEDPPTRHIYQITNIETFETDHPHEFEVQSLFTLYRNRSERDESTLMGQRKDILRKTGPGTFLIKGRLVLLQQSTLLAKNLSYFF